MCRDIKLLLVAEVDGLETTQKNLTVFSSVLLHSFLLWHAGSSCSFCSCYVSAQMWGKYAESKAKSQVTESLYETKAARTQQTTELFQVLL